ncbi:MAG: hypothetical protein HN350_04585 [Phycisphaerales bacterium]|nr:hypothetical protein [Phycisphaerales bacterium]
MSTKCTNWRTLNGVAVIVALTVVICLQSTAMAQVVRDVRTSTVTSGSGLDVHPTINGKRTSVGMGVMPSHTKVELVRGVAAAYFTRWGTHVEDGVAMLTMHVAIDGANRTQKIILPNKDPEGATRNPEDGVVKLAKTLKIGDAVMFNYLVYADQIFGANVQLFQRIADKPGAARFVYTGSKLVGSGKNKIMIVTAKAGVTPCVFKVPEEIGRDGKSKPIAKITDALKKFCTADLLELEYKTVDYQFVVTGVKAAKCTGRGFVTRITDTKRKGYKHMVAMIKTTKRIMTLIDPEAVIVLKMKNVSAPPIEPPVQTALKTLEPKNFVIFKYRRQRGVYWLDDIYPASPPPPKKTKPVKKQEKE